MPEFIVLNSECLTSQQTVIEWYVRLSILLKMFIPDNNSQYWLSKNTYFVTWFWGTQWPVETIRSTGHF